VAIVPEPDDLALSKLAAWRDKDRAWLASGMRAGLFSPLRMAERLPLMPGPDAALGMVDAAELARRIRSWPAPRIFGGGSRRWTTSLRGWEGLAARRLACQRWRADGRHAMADGYLEPRLERALDHVERNGSLAWMGRPDP